MDTEDSAVKRTLFEAELDGDKIYFISEMYNIPGFRRGNNYFHFGFSIEEVLLDFIWKQGIKRTFYFGDVVFCRKIVEQYKQEFDKLEPPDRNELKELNVNKKRVRKEEFLDQDMEVKGDSK